MQIYYCTDRLGCNDHIITENSVWFNYMASAHIIPQLLKLHFQNINILILFNDFFL